MCLISQRLKPFIAKKDLKVIKILAKDENGDYVTPYQRMKVKLNSLIKAKDEFCNKYENYNYNFTRLKIDSGYIHSLFKVTYEWDTDKNNVYVVAYIPKGTEYYVGRKFDVCSKELMLTNETVKFDDASVTYQEMMDILSPIKGIIDKKHVCAGWLLRSDKSFVHPSECVTEDIKKDIIGVVGCVINNNAIVLALDEEYHNWCFYNIEKTKFPFIDVKEVDNDFDGKSHTEIVKDYKDGFDAFLACNYCLQYKTKGTNEGEWYLPSSGEVYSMFSYNSDKIDYSLLVIGQNTLSTGIYWTSSCFNTSSSWTYDNRFNIFAIENAMKSYIVRPVISIKIK